MHCVVRVTPASADGKKSKTSGENVTRRGYAFDGRGGREMEGACVARNPVTHNPVHPGRCCCGDRGSWWRGPVVQQLRVCHLLRSHATPCRACMACMQEKRRDLTFGGGEIYFGTLSFIGHSSSRPGGLIDKTQPDCNHRVASCGMDAISFIIRSEGVTVCYLRPSTLTDVLQLYCHQHQCTQFFF
jgi:hypothetical protein